MALKLKTNYVDIFGNNTIIITGCGHDGTTLLGRLLATLKPTYYLWEPRIFKLLIYPEIKEQILATIFDDYFMPQILGRILNSDPSHVAYHKYHWATSEEEIKKRRENMGSRTQVIPFIKKEKPIFIIKLISAQPYIKYYKQIFPLCKFIHITSNGLDVLRFMVGHRFYTDQYYDIFEAEPMDREKGLPWWMPENVKESWNDWDDVTKAANHWRLMVQSYPVSIHYEDLCNGHLNFVKYLANEFGLELTDMTYEFAKEILPYNIFREKQIEMHGNPQPITYDMIQEPERSKFINLQKSLGYYKED